MNYHFTPEQSKCDHGNDPEKCRACKRLDDAWQSLGETLREMGEEEPGW